MASTNDSGTSANSSGKGSTYAGTQSPDPNAPDGYQKPQEGQEGQRSDEGNDTNLGEEYAGDSSYGAKEQSPDTAAGEKGEDAETDARGSGIR